MIRPDLPSAPSKVRLDESVALAVVDAVPDGVLVTDSDGSIVLVNRRSVDLFGYSRVEFIGMSVDDLLPASLRRAHAGHRSSYAQVPRRREMGSGLELVARRRSGEEFPVEVSLSPLAIDGRPHVVATVRDVTVRRIADAQLRGAQQRLAMTQERERIGRDLHDSIIQRLYGTGLGLQAALARADPVAMLESVGHAIGEIDNTITEIRSVIFDLHASADDPRGLRSLVTELVSELSDVYGYQPSVHFVGRIDREVGQDAADDALAVIREALSNAGRHAQAHKVVVDVEVGVDAMLTVRVVDDGCGFDPDLPNTGSGLRNIATRAQGRGGRCAVSSTPAKGTVVEWEVPLSS